MKVLIIEDSPICIEVLEEIFTRVRFSYDVVTCGEEAIEYALSYEYDVILLDLMLPGMSGEEVLNKLRLKGIITPIIVVSAVTELSSQTEGLNNGADDYVCKPFSEEILLARIIAVVRRSKGKAMSVITLGSGVTIDLGCRKVSCDGDGVALTTTEYKILELLSLNKKSVVSKERILDHLYNSTAEQADTVSIDTYIHRIRKKLRQKQNDMNLIKTSYGMGYYIEKLN